MIVGNFLGTVFVPTNIWHGSALPVVYGTIPEEINRAADFIVARKRAAQQRMNARSKCLNTNAGKGFGYCAVYGCARKLRCIQDFLTLKSSDYRLVWLSFPFRELGGPSGYPPVTTTIPNSFTAAFDRDEPMMHLDIDEFSSGAVSARACLEELARVLGVELDDSPDAVLSLVVDDVLPVTVAHGNHGRVALACNIAHVDDLTQPAWIAALGAAAQWGLDGEALRFVVIDRYLMLLWTVRPGPAVRVLIEQAEGVIARAREVQRVLAAHRLDHRNHPGCTESPSAVSNASQHRR